MGKYFKTSIEKGLDTAGLMEIPGKRETAKAEDMMRSAVVSAHRHFDEMYK